MILNKPYTNEQYANLATQANQNGQRLEQDEIAVYAIYPYEIVQDGKIINISDTEEYIAKQKQIEKEKITKETLCKIYDLEQEQFRAIREMIVNPNDFAKNKLIDIDKKIKDLRSKL